MTSNETRPAELDLDAVSRAELADIERAVLIRYTLADAIRDGCRDTRQAFGQYGHGDRACALVAGALAARARGRI
jgi:hypothetical protein